MSQKKNGIILQFLAVVGLLLPTSYVGAQPAQAFKIPDDCLPVHIIDPANVKRSSGISVEKQNPNQKKKGKDSHDTSSEPYILSKADGKVKMYLPGYLGLKTGTDFMCKNGAVVKITRTGPSAPYFADGIWHHINPLPRAEMIRLSESFQPKVREGGRSKSSSAIAAPLMLSWARLDHFELHWDAAVWKGKGEISLQNGPQGRTLWRESDVDLSQDSFDIKSLVIALHQWRNSAAPGRLVKLTIKPAEGTPVITIFHLLSNDEETQLSSDLSWWETHSQDMARSLGRAAAFAKYGLVYESCQEYEQAAHLDPEDPLVQTLAQQLQ